MEQAILEINESGDWRRLAAIPDSAHAEILRAAAALQSALAGDSQRPALRMRLNQQVLGYCEHGVWSEQALKGSSIAYQRWRWGIKQAAVPHIDFQCPHCHQPITVLRPSYDYRSPVNNCPWCGNAFGYTTYPQGSVVIVRHPARAFEEPTA